MGEMKNRMKQRGLITVILGVFLVYFPGTVRAVEVDSEVIQAIYLAQNGLLTADQKKSFDELSPEEQEQIQKNYQKFKNLPDPKKDALKERYRKWEELPPGTKEELRKEFKEQRKNKK